ncbi:polyprenyl synthetase family protein [Candidatus Daviesbacteria bacterium]|nr:polyprenyl synthetase family protein [Candidatus Daviesbacteria bacterium]
MDFDKFSFQTVKKINKALDLLLKEWKKEWTRTDRKLIPLVDQFIKSCAGGKMLRGVLVVMGHEIARSKVKDIYKVAAAYEIFHTAILVHDDIIDKSPIRRNLPSLYMALGANHYGVSQAISLADAGFFLAVRTISESDFSEEAKIQALKWFCQTMLDTAAGQLLDVGGGDAITVAKLKTARYTIAGPLILGVKLAGEDQKTIASLADFGENLGIAFQIKDDILDGEAEKYKQSLQQLRCCKTQAMKIIPEITKGPGMSKLLQQMAEYLVERKK